MDIAGVANRLAESLLDAVMPLRRRSARTRARRAEHVPLCPSVHELLGIRITTLLDYRESAARDLIQSLKYDASPHAARLAGTLLTDYLREEISSFKFFSTKQVLVVPIPLHASRMRERGFNQIELALRSLPREFRDGTLARLAPHALERVRRTEPQTKLHRVERLRNVTGAFEVPDPSLVRMKVVYLIDDVTTTGSTLKHAAAPLRKAGADVHLIALARA